MAGKKITELPELGTAPEAADWLIVVDVSDTSESAQGTTKKVLKSNAIVSQISEGEWTPTFETSATSVTNVKSTYIAFNQYVDVICYISIDNASLIENVTFTISPPTGFDMDGTSDLNCLGVINLVNAAFTTFIYATFVSQNSGLISCTLNSVDPAPGYDLIILARYKRA